MIYFGGDDGLLTDLSQILELSKNIVRILREQRFAQ